MRFVGFAMIGLTALALSSAARAADTVTLSNCVLSPDAQVDVPAQERGVLVAIPVREGQHVAKGELLAQIDDLVPRMQQEVAKYKLDVARKQAHDDVDVRYARNAADVTKMKYEKSLQANRNHRGTVTEVQLREERLEWEKFVLMIEKAQKDLDVAKLQVKVSEAELQAADANREHRRLVAPLDGVVVELVRHEGEWVQEGETVMQLVRVDLLRVEGKLNVKKYRPSEIQDRPVEITVTLPNDKRATFPGKIVFVSPLVATDGWFQVRAEVHNRVENGVWVLNPGMSAEMTIQLK